MRYDISKSEVRQLLNTANVLNTLHGGTIEPQIHVERDTLNYHITVKIPGIDEDRLKVEIAEKHLIVSHEMIFESENEKVLSVPHVLAACPLSLDIDHDRITADFENGILEVRLPLSDFTSGYRREIDINKH